MLCSAAECGNKRFFAAVGQADFVTWITAQTQDFWEAKSACLKGLPAKSKILWGKEEQRNE